MPLRVDVRAWAKVLAHYGTPRRPRSFDEPLWIGPEPLWYRVELGVPPDWAYLVICTKDSCVRWWSEQGASPADIAVASAQWWTVHPLDGGLILSPETLLSPIRRTTYDDFLVAVEGANVAGRKSLAAQFPEYVERARSARAGRE